MIFSTLKPLAGLTLGQRCAHDDTADAGRSREVSLAALSPAGGQVGVDLGHLVGWARADVAAVLRRRRWEEERAIAKFEQFWREGADLGTFQPEDQPLFRARL